MKYVIVAQLTGRVGQDIQAIIPAVERIQENVVNGVKEAIEERAVNAGTVTRDGLDMLLSNCLQRAGVFELVARLNSNTATMVPAAPVVTPPPNTTPHADLFMWEGQLRLLPQDFKLPDGNIFIAWQHWCCGNSVRGYPALRNCKPSDIFCDKERKKFSEFKFVMKILEEACGRTPGRNCSIELANELFERGQAGVELEARTTQNRERRVAQMKWTSVAYELRTIRKRARTN